MNISSPEEFKKTTTVTVGLVLWIAAVSFSMGMIYKDIVDSKADRQSIRDFVIQEVGGLRSDWERQYEDDIDPRIEKLESRHD